MKNNNKDYSEILKKATHNSNLLQQIEMILFDHKSGNTLYIAEKILEWHKSKLKTIEESIPCCGHNCCCNHLLNNDKRKA